MNLLCLFLIWLTPEPPQATQPAGGVWAMSWTPTASAHGGGASHQPCSRFSTAARAAANITFFSLFLLRSPSLGINDKVHNQILSVFPQLRPTRYFPLSLCLASPWSLSKRDVDRSTQANGTGEGLRNPGVTGRSPILPAWLPPEQGSVNCRPPTVGPLPSAPSTIPQASPLVGP